MTTATPREGWFKYYGYKSKAAAHFFVADEPVCGTKSREIHLMTKPGGIVVGYIACRRCAKKIGWNLPPKGR